MGLVLACLLSVSILCFSPLLPPCPFRAVPFVLHPAVVTLACFSSGGMLYINVTARPL